jgi:hypothetical protein
MPFIVQENIVSNRKANPRAIGGMVRETAGAGVKLPAYEPPQQLTTDQISSSGADIQNIASLSDTLGDNYVVGS